MRQHTSHMLLASNIKPFMLLCYSLTSKAPSDSKLLLVVILIVAVESLPPTALLISDVVYSPVGTTVDRERPSTVNVSSVL